MKKKLGIKITTVKCCQESMEDEIWGLTVAVTAAAILNCWGKNTGWGYFRKAWGVSRIEKNGEISGA